MTATTSTAATTGTADISTAAEPTATTTSTSSPTAMVDIRGAHKSFGDLHVLRGIDLQVEPGTVTVILGPSGSGKSTLLRAINHLEKVDHGWVTVDGELIGYRRKGARLYELREREILRQRSEIGFVFQNFNLFGHLTVLENVIEAPLSAQKRKRKDVEPLARELLERVGVAEKAHDYPRRLSGGQQQGVAIARALALQPKLILFDEPTSALDPELVGEILDVIVGLADTGTTMIVVTQEIGFARQVTDDATDRPRPVDGAVSAEVREAGSLLWIRHGDSVIELVLRGGWSAVRVRDPLAATRTGFSGVELFPADAGWICPGRFRRYPEARPVTVDTARVRPAAAGHRRRRGDGRAAARRGSPPVLPTAASDCCSTTRPTATVRRPGAPSRVRSRTRTASSPSISTARSTCRSPSPTSGPARRRRPATASTPP